MKVLFLGNSYTYCNNLPGMLQDLAQARGETIETRHVTSGGKTLDWHWYNPASLDAIDAGGWDFVVLQEQSTRPVEDPDKMASAAARLAERIKSVGAKPVFYMSWAREHIPEMHAPLTKNILRVSKEIGADVAPVGLAWAEARAASPELGLYTNDRSHPNTFGTYLAVCVFYATLTGNSPVGLTNTFTLEDGVSAVLDPDKAKFLQEMAQAGIEELRK